MRRVLTILVAGILMLGATAPVATPKAEWRWRYCRFQSLEKAKWTKREVHLTIHCALSHFPASHSTADYVAQKESGLTWWATNPSSGACGVYQHIPRYWPGRVTNFNQARPKWHLAPSCYNARSNVLVAIRMASNYGWRPWGM